MSIEDRRISVAQRAGMVEMNLPELVGLLGVLVHDLACVIEDCTRAVGTETYLTAEANHVLLDVKDNLALLSGICYGLGMRDRDEERHAAMDRMDDGWRDG
jgi:hypothetical protein